MFLVLVLGVFVLFVFYSWISFIRDTKTISAPGPSPWPLFGNGLSFLGDTSTFLATIGKYKEEYGDAVRIYLLSSRYLILSNPLLFEPIISSTEHITKGEAYDYLHPWLGQGLLTSTGYRWKSHRKLLTPAFHFNILQTFLPTFIKNQHILTKKLRKLADGTSFDLFPIVALAALDNVAESAMGVSINAQEDYESKYVRAIADMSELSMMRIFNPIMAVNPIFNLLPHKTKFDKALSTLHGHTTKVIEERSKQLKESNVTLANYTNSELGIKKRSSFLDLLLLSEVDGERLNFEKIREEVDTFMFEGHDTTTSAICFILYCISTHKDVESKLLEEQKAIFGDDLQRDPTSVELQQMKYLELVIKEGLRIYPTVPLIGRMMTKDSTISGMRIPKGTTVTMNIFHMQRDPKTFEDPLEFRPERFESVNTINQQTKSAFSWVAFSAGPRNCIGQKFAMMELKVCISSMVKNFKILPSGIEPIVSTDLVLRSKNGVNIKLLPRD